MTFSNTVSLTPPTFSLSIQFLGILSRWISKPFRMMDPLLVSMKRLIYLTAAQTKLPALHGSVQVDGPIVVVGTADIQIGLRSRISRDVELGTEENGKIKIGESVRINRGTTLFAYREILIGDHTLIGEFVTVRDANHGIAPDQLVRAQGHDSKAITIGRDVWIGRGSVILPGVNIGDGCIIGANSVVTKSIEAGMIAVGTPAKPVRRR